jgi:polysaccharide biosynthesis/export protein
MSIARFVLLFLSLLALTACAHTGPERTGDAASFTKGGSSETATYRIGPDDQLQVNVWRNPDLSVSVPVRPDGMISVPLIGDVKAGGQTPQQVSESIRQRLTEYLREPQVTVIVTELRSHEFISRIRVTGAVGAPMSLPYRQGMTVLDAVLQAGGVTEFAAADRAKLYRRQGESTNIMDVRLGRILSRGDLQTNVYLQPGDIISVPERLF